MIYFAILEDGESIDYVTGSDRQGFFQDIKTVRGVKNRLSWVTRTTFSKIGYDVTHVEVYHASLGGNVGAYIGRWELE